MDVQMTEAAAPMSVDVLHLINEERQTYGLRHQDYQRYREHVTNRVRRLRQTLKLTQPNNKKNYQKKELPDEFSDPRYLHLYIFDTERAWAYAMEIKQESTTSMNLRKRHHLTKRLKRASQYAETLYKECEKQTVDSRTVLDAKAYAATMKGYLLFEQQQWQEALDQFVSARTIYERFAQAIENAHQEALCYSAIDAIDPNIRFCAYKLQLDEGNSAHNIDEIVDSLRKKNAAGMALLEAQLEKVTQENRMERTRSLSKITWRGHTFSANEAVADAIAKAMESSGREETSFDQVLADWADAEKLVKKSLKESKDAIAKVSSSKSAEAMQSYELLYSYVSYNLYARSIQRNLQLASEVEARQGKPQELVKLYDDILKNVDSIRDLPLMRDDNQLEWELEILSYYYKSARCVYIAWAYVDTAKTAEALALYQRAQTYVVQAKQMMQKGSFSEDALLSVSEDDLQKAEHQIRTGIWKARATWYLEHGVASDGSNQEEISSKMNELRLDAGNRVPLIERLNVYPSTLVDAEKQTPYLVDFPPAFEPVACKPFYFDLASNYVKFPDALSERVEKPSSGLWSYFGFGGK
ncbi:uncharacterized protein BYT42DRAFT_251343 [Radiomyces spectabilis]|uniref:uncharacterized protein n=1 Tax=Radiomyces spectabilis TaxID=64574 RepID=UPI0022211D39|nr:uncharacterized protein BYT42DRAFT_251343 [Radiomyces spectabilis]KAI8388898.1 hypothetical protein BYT42DRAFT_251343 [Radiomyces spectabilis]